MTGRLPAMVLALAVLCGPVMGGRYSQQIDRHIAMLEVGSVAQRIDAARKLANIGVQEHRETPAPMDQVEARRAVGALIRASETTGGNGPLNIPRHMGRLLAGTTGPETTTAVTWLIKMLEKDTNGLRHPAIEVLGLIGPPAAPAAGALAKLLEGGNDDRRREVLKALGKIGPAARAAGGPVRKLIATCKLAPPRAPGGLGPAEMQLTAFATLGRMGAIRAEDAKPIARAIAAAESSYHAYMGAKILLDMPHLPAEIAGDLVKALSKSDMASSPSLAHRGHLIQAIARVGSATALPLCDLLEGDGPCRYDARRALRFLGPKAKPAVGRLVALLKKQPPARTGQHYGFGESMALPPVIAAIGPAAIEPLAAVLQHDSDRTRALAVMALGAITDPAAASHVIAALADKSSLVQTTARIALVYRGVKGGRYVDAICRAVASDSPAERGMASAALQGFFMARQSDRLAALSSSAKVCENMTVIVRDRRAVVRCRAVQVLCTVRPVTKQTLSLLTDMLRRDGDRVVRTVVAERLGGMERAAAPAAAALAEALSDPDPGVRNSAARALCRVGPAGRAAKAQLVKALADPKTERDARQALKSLDLYHGDLPVLMADLKTAGQRGEGRSILFEIAQLGPKAAAAVPLIIEQLDSREYEVVDAAAYALWKIGAKSTDAIPPLTRAVASTSARARIHAMRALLPLRATSAAPNVIKNLRHDIPSVRVTAAKWLGQMKIAAAAGRLVATLRDPDAAVRAEAAVALGRIAPTTDAAKARSALESLLADRNAMVRVCAAYALVCMAGDPPSSRHLPALLAFASDANVAVRERAASLIGQLPSAVVVQWALKRVFHRIAELEKATPALAGFAKSAELAGTSLRFEANATPYGKASVPRAVDPTKPFCSLSVHMWRPNNLPGTPHVDQRSYQIGPSRWDAIVRVNASDRNLSAKVRAIFEQQIAKARAAARAARASP